MQKSQVPKVGMTCWREATNAQSHGSCTVCTASSCSRQNLNTTPSDRVAKNTSCLDRVSRRSMTVVPQPRPI